MATSSQVDANELCTEISVHERGSETILQFTPGLDSETIGIIGGILTEEAKKSGPGNSPFGRYSISHSGSKSDNSSLTNVTSTHNHFGRFRHHHAERFTEAAGAVLLGEAGVKVKIVHTPTDFGLSQINDSLGQLSS